MAEEQYRTIISRYFPELADSPMSLSSGWHSVAVDVDNHLIFKFPKSSEAETALKREAAFLAIIRPALTLPVPDMVLLDGPPVFSRHEKLQGEHLTTTLYETLPEQAREHLGRQIARFYCELHGLVNERMREAGAQPIEPWFKEDRSDAEILSALPITLHENARQILEDYRNLPPDPYGKTYGFFDGHGWNMAFDAGEEKLNGIYDFADSGFGDLHQEFIYTNFISADLTGRILAEYEKLTGKSLDRKRIGLLTAAHRLSEVSETLGDAEQLVITLEHAIDWLSMYSP